VSLGVNAPGALPRWPKGPFPERYRFGVVEARLRGAWDDPLRVALLARLAREGLAPVEGEDDPWLRLFAPRAEGPDGEAAGRALAAARELAKGAACLAFAWGPPARERARGESGVVGVVPTADPVDALSAVGVAGPKHGIGMPALVRFLVTLRSFARFEIVVMGEDRLELTLATTSEEALARVAERVTHLCPPLARRSDPTAIAATIRETGLLVLDWS
jgi:hypothetical protein